MGERFAAASRPGPGQWAAVARALELCRTQPSACPRAPPAHLLVPRMEGLGGPQGGHDLHLTATSATRTTARLTVVGAGPYGLVLSLFFLMDKPTHLF